MDSNAQAFGEKRFLLLGEGVYRSLPPQLCKQHTINGNTGFSTYTCQTLADVGSAHNCAKARECGQGARSDSRKMTDF